MTTLRRMWHQWRGSHPEKDVTPVVGEALFRCRCGARFGGIVIENGRVRPSRVTWPT